MKGPIYHTTDSRGVSELCPDKARLRAIIETLNLEETTDQAHPDVSLIHDDKGWSIALYPGGIATLENLNDRDETAPCFLRNVDSELAYSLWCQLAEGRIEALRQLDWHKP